MTSEQISSFSANAFRPRALYQNIIRR
jgi:hypothetical protein